MEVFYGEYWLAFINTNCHSDCVGIVELKYCFFLVNRLYNWLFYVWKRHLGFYECITISFRK